MTKSFFKSLLKKKEEVKVEVSIEDVNKKDITLVAKKISGEGSYRIYINEWKYNLQGFKLKGQSKHSINTSYLIDGTNVLRVVVRGENKEIADTLYKEFDFVKAS